MAPPTASTVPPVLPPSVEESYRRKCIQLKQRMNEVEEANDTARLRLVRMQRAIEKMRMERAFLLEQLAKRTSTNVEDSEGSPSPPPTPKEKPLRTKRGHRKPSFLAGTDMRPSNAFIQQGPVTLSPSSDAFSHSHPDASAPAGATPAKGSALTNGHTATSAAAATTTVPKTPRSAYEVYCNDLRSVLMVKNRRAIAEGVFDTELALAQGWHNMPMPAQESFHTRLLELQREEAEKLQGAATTTDAEKQPTPEDEKKQVDADEDVEMAEDGDEAGSTEGGGFRAVNRGS